MRPLSPGGPTGPSTVLDSQTWPWRARKSARSDGRFRRRVGSRHFCLDVGPGPRVWPLTSQVVFLGFAAVQSYTSWMSWMPSGLANGSDCPLRAIAEGADVRVRPFRVFGDRHFMRSLRQLPSCLALPPRPLFLPLCGNGLSPLGRRVLLSACTASSRVLAGGLVGGRRCLAADGCEKRSTRSPLSIPRRTRPWTALVRSNDCRALVASPFVWMRSGVARGGATAFQSGYFWETSLRADCSLRIARAFGTPRLRVERRAPSGLALRSILRPVGRGAVSHVDHRTDATPVCRKAGD